MNDDFNDEEDPLGLGPVDEEIARQREAAGGDLEFADPLEIIRQDDPVLAEYLERLDGDGTNWDRPLDLLAQRGIVLPPADELDDEALSEKLWEVIWGLADLGGYLNCTNHLSDRELYKRLREETLREETLLMPGHLDYACHFDMSSDIDGSAYLKYYADEATRWRCAEEDPNTPLPERETPPYDRDRDLPERPQPLWASDEPDESPEADDAGGERTV